MWWKKKKEQPSLEVPLAYQFKQHEWNLTAEEEERQHFIKFIVERGNLSDSEEGALNHFRAESFQLILTRLQIALGPPIEFWYDKPRREFYSRKNIGYWNCFSVSDDCKKLIGCSVERK